MGYQIADMAERLRCAPDVWLDMKAKVFMAVIIAISMGLAVAISV